MYNKCTCIGGRLENEPGRPALLCQRRLPGFLIYSFSMWWDFPHFANILHILDLENSSALSWISVVFFSGLDIIFWILTRYPIFPPQGVAASNLPTTVFAVIDMYGKCAQVANSLILQVSIQISIDCIILMMFSTGVFDG